ncbi:GNAT family N-acetyltransferase [Nioella aestuarii]|uniref:GNAT family N-acetyltransferase n=1 Tax=Nioella aestuarii TaxID=1662864 RepID=UPI003D7F3BDE
MIRWPLRLRIRRLVADDAALWRDLRLEALANHPEAHGATHDDWAGRPLTDFAESLGAGCILGAFKGDALVGSMALDASDSRGEITAVYVRADQRNKGIARRLFKVLRREARGSGIQCLSLTVAETNLPALRFYESVGFHPTGQPSRALARDGRLLNLLTMTMAL